MRKQITIDYLGFGYYAASVKLYGKDRMILINREDLVEDYNSGNARVRNRAYKMIMRLVRISMSIN